MFSMQNVFSKPIFNSLSKQEITMQSLQKASKYVYNIIQIRMFRGRGDQQGSWQGSSSFLRKAADEVSSKEIDQLKVAFTEGYLAGASKSATTTPAPSRFGFRTIIFLATGGLIGFITGVIYASISNIPTTTNGDIHASITNTTFSDVKGAEEAKMELQNLVEYLKRPQKFTSLGGKLPKGVLMVGPPGTGKTLLARALAGEAQVPFFHISGSEFEELFVGEGARRVRKLFKKAKMCAPCVIFIDEIDSVGGTRHSSKLHPHSNQTINQLLTEMDGFHRNEGIIVVGATNRKEDLDVALLRPGRFDVEVHLSLPSYQQRKDIFELYLGKVICKDIDTDVLARGTVGFTGADIENIVNRAALRGAMENQTYITMKNLEEQRDQSLMGAENKVRIPDHQTNVITAYHESGHCIVAYFTPHCQPIHKVSIIPRGRSLGHTAYLPDKDEGHINKAQVLAQIDASLGGRAAEELIFGSDFVTLGSSDDLRTANELATQMVARWGFSESMGLRVVDQKKMTADFEEEVKRILRESYERAKNILRKHSREHSLLAEELLKVETLDASDVKRILTGNK